jgi:hypothetical protein
MIKREQSITFTPPYNLSSSLHSFAETKERKFDTRNPQFGPNGLFSGNFHVITTKGIDAITPANTDNTSAHLAPFVIQAKIHIATITATNISTPVQLKLPFETRVNAVVVEPIPKITGTAGLAFCLNIVNTVIQDIMAQRPNVVRETPSPAPVIVLVIMKT